jgi:hypothetical protein
MLPRRKMRHIVSNGTRVTWRYFEHQHDDDITINDFKHCNKIFVPPENTCSSSVSSSSGAHLDSRRSEFDEATSAVFLRVRVCRHQRCMVRAAQLSRAETIRACRCLASRSLNAAMTRRRPLRPRHTDWMATAALRLPSKSLGR